MTTNAWNLPIYFGKTQNINKTVKAKHMKKLVTLTSIVSSMAVLALVAGCQTVATNNAEIAASKKQNLLAQSGFKVITVTTPKQQQAVSQIAMGRVSAVKYNGKLYYVYPTAKKDQIFVGRQKQYNAYKQALQAQQGQQQMAGTPVFTTETAGPNHIEVDQFDGFGPMGTEAMGNW
jgi:type II secretory pathway component GspD/PulD (secretin)